MLRITATANAKNYFQGALKQEDYYAQGNELPGTWHGQLAAQLGLEGIVTKEAFYAICENLHPQDGSKLKPRIRKDSIPGWDFTVSVPKSVSLLYGLTQNEEILQAFQEAVDEMMTAVEADICTRIRTNGRSADRQTGKALWATFVHTTSRPVNGIEDPHLHCHAYLSNLTFDTMEDRYKAAKIRTIWENAPYYETLFDKAMVSKLQTLGYAIADIADGWELQGIDRTTIRKFSHRTQEIESLASQKGIVTDKLKSELGARTRNHKREHISADQLQALWWERLNDDEQNALSHVLQKQQSPAEPSGIISPQQAVQEACNICFKRRSYISEKRLVAQAMRQHLASLSVDQIQQELDRSMKQSNLKLVQTLTGNQLIGKVNAKHQQSHLIQLVKQGLNSQKALCPTWKNYRFHSGELSDQDQDDIRSLLSSYNQIITINPKQQKPHFFEEIWRAIQQTGRTIFKTSSHTLPYELHRSPQSELTDQLLWVQAAHQLGVNELEKLFEWGHKHNNRLLLAADQLEVKKQDYGDGLICLKRELDVINRQQRSWENTTSQHHDSQEQCILRSLQIRRAEQENISATEINPFVFSPEVGRT